MGTPHPSAARFSEPRENRFRKSHGKVKAWNHFPWRKTDTHRPENLPYSPGDLINPLLLTIPFFSQQIKSLSHPLQKKHHFQVERRNATHIGHRITLFSKATLFNFQNLAKNKNRLIPVQKRKLETSEAKHAKKERVLLQ